MIQAETLLAVCDAVVTSQLETLGKRVLSADRSRYAVRREAGLPVWEAHTMWGTAPHVVEKSLSGSWDAARAVLGRAGLDHEDVERVVASLDGYVRELAQFRISHDLENLARRLGRDL